MLFRSYNTNSVSKDTVGVSAKYWGLGPWEKVRVSLSSLTTDAEGFKTLNLRGPLDHSYFNTNYEVAGQSTSAQLVNPRYGASGKFPFGQYTSPKVQANIYPYYEKGIGDTFMSTQVTIWAQYLFVLDDSGVEYTKGLMLRDFYSPSTRRIPHRGRRRIHRPQAGAIRNQQRRGQPILCTHVHRRSARIRRGRQ